MYEPIRWLDEVRVPDRTYSFRDNGDGTMTMALAGEQKQKGTNKSAANFNIMEQGIIAAHAAVDLLMSYVMIKLGHSDKTLDGLEAELRTVINNLDVPTQTEHDTLKKECMQAIVLMDAQRSVAQMTDRANASAISTIVTQLTALTS